MDAAIDLSRKVGWFTTIWPSSVEVNREDDIIDVVRRTKDARRQVTTNGWSYFTSRYLNDKGKGRFGGSGIMEIMFNYSGLYQQLERPEALLQQIPDDGQKCPDFSATMQRFAVFEISTKVIQGRLHFKFTYNRHIASYRPIPDWVDRCKESLMTPFHEQVFPLTSWTLHIHVHQSEYDTAS